MNNSLKNKYCVVSLSTGSLVFGLIHDINEAYVEVVQPCHMSEYIDGEGVKRLTMRYVLLFAAASVNRVQYERDHILFAYEANSTLTDFYHAACDHFIRFSLPSYYSMTANDVTRLREITKTLDDSLSQFMSVDGADDGITH